VDSTKSDKLLDWLQRVAAAVNADPSPLTIEVYLEELFRWKLSPEQWELVRRRAVMQHRFPKCLPMLPDLWDIAQDILQEAAARESAKQAMTPDPDAVPCPPEVKAQLANLRLVKP
jgi:hypothetical protein